MTEYEKTKIRNLINGMTEEEFSVAVEAMGERYFDFEEAEDETEE